MVELFNGNLNAGLIGVGPASVMDDDGGALAEAGDGSLEL
jgi:hypothetical protein